MHHLFLPDCYVEHFSNLNIAHLKEKQIRVLICDIDNTLAAHDCPTMDHAVTAFLQQVEASGIQVAIVSNNNKKRVSLFVGTSQYFFVSNAKKPLAKAFRKIQQRFDVSKQEMAMLGDQLLTDILGANRYGIHSILSKPLVESDIAWTKVNRVVEQVIYRYLEKHYEFKRGVYYDN